MNERFSDRAANERTYLAWMCTAIAVMALGFLVEKFDLFLEVATRTLEGRAAPVRHEAVGDVRAAADPARGCDDGGCDCPLP
ncbi:MAG: DUF202 domain-containing protein [Sphingomonas sp.]|nr:MAG: DUF202 domain-containing protein [Sphingomonas sp.]